MYTQIMNVSFIRMTIIVAIVLFNSVSFAKNTDSAPNVQNTGNVTKEIIEKINIHAFEKWKNLAVNGDKIAQYNLGVLYQNGWGVSRDYVQAQKWYILSSWQENKIEQSYLDILTKKLSPFQTVEANILAKNCLKTEYTNCGSDSIKNVLNSLESLDSSDLWAERIPDDEDSPVF